MDNRTDQEYLRNQQYRNAANLRARINLHLLYKTNPYDWFHWVFDHFQISENASLLELGCGSANLWINNLDRVPLQWSITLSDFSPGMLVEAREKLSVASRLFHYAVIDAQHIPAADKQFDAVIANHMIYHIHDQPKAFAEIHRVLKPGGTLFCATNGEQHLKEFDAFYGLIQPYLLSKIERTFSAGTFTLENGDKQLSPWFTTKLEHYPDELIITDAEPLVAYLLSMVPMEGCRITAGHITTLRNYIEDKIQKDGSIHITKSTGLFIAHKQTTTR